MLMIQQRHVQLISKLPRYISHKIQIYLWTRYTWK